MTRPVPSPGHPWYGRMSHAGNAAALSGYVAGQRPGDSQATHSRCHSPCSNQLVWHHRCAGSRWKTSSRNIPIRRKAARKIHMIWTDSPSWTTCWNDSNTYTQSLAKTQRSSLSWPSTPGWRTIATLPILSCPLPLNSRVDDIGDRYFHGRIQDRLHRPESASNR